MTVTYKLEDLMLPTQPVMASQVNFRMQHVKDVTLCNARFYNCNFSGIDMERCRFYNCEFFNCNWNGITVDSLTEFINCTGGPILEKESLTTN